MFHSLIFGVNNSNSYRSAGAHRIASVMRENGWDCEVIDWTMFWKDYQLTDLLKTRITKDTKIIGFSTFVNIWDPKLDTLCKWIKENYPHVCIVLGGQEVLKTNVDKRYIDWYVDSFGDIAIVELCKYIASNGKRPITDLSEQARSGKRLIRCLVNYQAFPMKSLFVNYEERDFIDQYESLTTEIGRGCVFHCDFCNFPILGVKGDFSRDAEDFERNLKKNYDQWGVKTYYIADETFNDRTEKIIKFADVVEKLNFKPWFAAFTRADLLISRKQDREHMARMGVMGQFYGIESLNYASAKSVGKGMKTEKLLDGLLELKEYFKSQGPYRASISLITGLQHETLETLDNGLQWLLNNWTDQNVIYFPLTIPSEQEENLSILSKEWHTRGYEQIDDRREITEEAAWKFLHSGDLPPLLWKNEHMDIYQATDFVVKFGQEHLHKFKKSNWDMGNMHRDYRKPISELLNVGALDPYPPEVFQFRTDFINGYIDKKLNFRPKKSN